MTNYITLIVLTLILSSASPTDAKRDSFTVLYEADANGKQIAGSLEALIDAIHNGNQVRVGWTLTFADPVSGDPIEMEHWTEASFITILQGHVFAQVQSIYQQGPGIGDPPSVFLVNNQANGWVAILGTTGVMRQKYNESDMQIPEAMRKEMETMRVPTRWAVTTK